MIPAKRFNPSTLKPGDEVGVTWRSLFGQAHTVSKVVAIEDGGFIRVEDQELPFWPDDGREVEIIWDGVATPSPNGLRLCEPCDEGRAESLRNVIWADMEELEPRLHDLTLVELRQLDGEIKALLTKYPVREAIDIPVVEDTGHILKFVHGD